MVVFLLFSTGDTSLESLKIKFLLGYKTEKSKWKKKSDKGSN